MLSLMLDVNAFLGIATAFIFPDGTGKKKINMNENTWSKIKYCQLNVELPSKSCPTNPMTNKGLGQ